MTHRLRRALPYATAGLVVLLFAAPVLYLLAVSFKTPDEVLTGTLLTSTPTLDNWPAAFARVPLLAFLRNSVLAAASGAAVSLLIAFPAAYAIDRHRTGGTLLPALALGSYMAPPVVALIPLFYLLRSLHLLNTLPALTLVYGLTNTPVALWLLGGFLRHVPREIDEAAETDGAGTLRVLWHVILPVILPGLLTTGLICGILNYNEFLFASIYGSTEAARTLPVGLSLFQGERLVNFGQMAAASLAGMVPVYLCGLFFQKRLVAGLVAGSVR